MRIPATGADDAGCTAYLSATLEVAGADKKIAVFGVARTADPTALAGHYTAKTVTIGNRAVVDAASGRGKRALESVKGLAVEMKAVIDRSAANNELADPRLTALHADVAGRMTKAFSGAARFKRWGMHCLRVLTRAHQLQICTNFMDTGLQIYGGDLFRGLRAAGDTVFLSLPAPTPTRNAASVVGRGSAAVPAPSMSTYYAGSGGGCFAPWSTVEVANRRVGWTTTTVSEVRAGDIIRTNGGRATVRCTVNIARPELKRLVELTNSGLCITGRHPIMRDGRWCVPRDQPDAVRCDRLTSTVTNFVLDSNHVILVNGVECVTWGHGLTEPTIAHGYFGTEKILDDLARLPGWNVGAVTVAGFSRSDEGAVVGIGPLVHRTADWSNRFLGGDCDGVAFQPMPGLSATAATC